MKEQLPPRPADISSETPPSPIFQPFQDRLSRDIRNDLSRAFSRAITGNDLSPVESLAGSLLGRDLDPCYRDYVVSRLGRYRRAFNRIQGGDSDPFRHGLILWDLQLFFEVHEVLEHAWYHAQGDRKLLLQAMIRAAGVYIKLEFGYTRQAGKMADKALLVLEKDVDALRDYFAPEELLTALRTLDPHPPILLKGSDPVSG